MPRDAPAIKIANTKGFGAEVLLYDRYTQDREAIARAIAAERGFAVVPPYDDPEVIAGQGSVGLEIALDLLALGLKPDNVLVPCSGGGLASGVALAVKASFPAARVYSCEPATLDDTARSLAGGHRVSNPPEARSICDALMSQTPGELTFKINSRLLEGGLSATDPEVLAAMAFAIRRLKLVVEPGGAVGLAALLSGRIQANGQTTVVVLSGGNADDSMIQRALAEKPASM
jgi:threonine dehydratase